MKSKPIFLKLNEEFKLPFISDLVARKTGGTEKGRLNRGEFQKLLADAKALEAQLDPASQQSGLPETVGNMVELDDFLVKVRKAI